MNYSEYIYCFTADNDKLNTYCKTQKGDFTVFMETSKEQGGETLDKNVTRREINTVALGSIGTNSSREVGFNPMTEEDKDSTSADPCRGLGQFPSLEEFWAD